MRSNFKKILKESIELLKIEQNEPIVELGNDYRWNKNSSMLHRDNKIVRLKASETSLLELFILKKNQKVSLEQIYLYLWGDSSMTFNATSIRNIVVSLRKKLPQNLINSVYGGNYIFKYDIPKN